MEEQVDRLVSKVWKTLLSLLPTSRYLIAISGIPGAGKTTLATAIVTRLNNLATSIPNTTDSSPFPFPLPVAVHIPMDGYHYPRSHLSTMPNSAEAFARRGAAFTFDAEAYLNLVQRIREPLVLAPEPSTSTSASTSTFTSNTTSSSTSSPTPIPTPTIRAPSFSHSLKDPVENDIPIPPSARICVFEGNYVGFDVAGSWGEARALMDEVWWVEVSEEVAVRRLAKRHLEAGIVGTLEEGEERARGSDMRNGREIAANKGRVEEEVVTG